MAYSIEGTAEHPATLFLFYMFATGVLELVRKRHDIWFRLGLVPVVLGLSAGGVGWTVGAAHVTSTGSMLVWAGMATLPWLPRGRQGPPRPEERTARLTANRRIWTPPSSKK